MRIFFDENLSEYVAQALNLLSRGYFPQIEEVISTKNVPGLGLGKPDEEIIPFIGRESGVLITRDRRIARIQTKGQLCKTYGVIVVVIRFSKAHDRVWDSVKLLINHWENLIGAVTTPRHPFGFQLTSHGLKEL